MADPRTPVEYRDESYDPSVEPTKAKAWWNLIIDAQKAFETYQDKCDNIDKQHADLERLAATSREREMQVFWANMQVVGPSIYSRPPIPVVTPRFKDRRTVQVAAAELLERAVSVNFELGDFDGVMRQIRDDLAVLGRGVPWCRYEAKDKSERVCVEHLDRRDFLHDPARKWADVGWVAIRAWMTAEEMRERFEKHSGDEWRSAAFNRVDRKADEDGFSDPLEKCGVWEIWSKAEEKVVWVAEGCENVLDEGAPHLKLEGFFPCPRPAYATLRRGTLVPVPDMLFYKDQLEEVNELTARIAALADSIKVRGFYPAGAKEIGDAVEEAVKSLDNRQVLIPISNWASLGSGGDVIQWLPIDMVANVITQLVALRKQVIDDVYQISGLSDILRGATDPNETLGAQELKAQTGSRRVKDRQDELVRISRDVTRIVAEIMAENFAKDTLLDMTQMQIASDADIARQVKEIEGQAKAMAAGPQAAQMAQENPEQAQQMMAQAQEAVGKLKETPTIEKVVKLLRDQRIRPFMLDIETDSTIAPDENAQKQRATEYVTAISGLLNQAQVLQQIPQLAPVVADIIKFANSQFRVGREIQQTVDDFTEEMKKMAAQPKPPDPQAVKAEADAKAAQQQAQMDQARMQMEMQAQQAELAQRSQELQQQAAMQELERAVKAREAEDASEARRSDIAMKAAEARMKLEQLAAQADAAAEKHAQDMEKGAMDLELARVKIEQSRVATENSIATTQAGVDAKRDAAAQKPANGRAS